LPGSCASTSAGTLPRRADDTTDTRFASRVVRFALAAGSTPARSTHLAFTN
jgi:hypothetical protein